MFTTKKLSQVFPIYTFQRSLFSAEAHFFVIDLHIFLDLLMVIAVGFQNQMIPTDSHKERQGTSPLLQQPQEML